MTYNHIYNIVKEEIDKIISNNSIKITSYEIHSLLIKNKVIRNIFEIKTPIIENVSDILGVKGKILVVRMDKMYGITGFKKPIFASLILMKLIQSIRKNQYNQCWIDGGNVNSSLALAYYAKKFSGEAAIVMSHLFPQYVLDYIREISNNSIKLIKAPDLSLGIERDFYKYLVNLVRYDSVYKTYQPLWHAKYSGQYSQFLGLDLADELSINPDYIISGIGSGSTIEGQAIIVKQKYNNHPKIVVPEHCLSSLLSTKKSVINSKDKINLIEEYPSDWFCNPPQEIAQVPHMVLGPHYDEINPLLHKPVLNAIDYVYLYNDNDWKQMSYKCYLSGFKIGNSSAANLVASKYLAEKGYNILTFIYEPFRSIYQFQHNSDKTNINKYLHSLIS